MAVARRAGLCESSPMIDWHSLFTGPLDRMSAMRRDDAWMAEKMRDHRTRFVLVWRDRNLLIAGDAPQAVTLAGPRVREILTEAACETALLGLEGETAYFAADLSHREPTAFAELLGQAEFVDIRNARPLLEESVGGLLLQARGLMYWHRQNRFCAACGHPTLATTAGYSRRCTNADCGREHFPRLDPAIIVLVTRPTPEGEVCLLAHKAEWPDNRFSTIAGFVEPGETIEDAVRREVMEETGVTVVETQYRGSQPWPFPASLMLGFRASAVDPTIQVDNDEVAEARWFTRDDILNAAQRGFSVTRGGSISSWLVDGWLKEGE